MFESTYKFLSTYNSECEFLYLQSKVFRKLFIIIIIRITLEWRYSQEKIFFTISQYAIRLFKTRTGIIVERELITVK